MCKTFPLDFQLPDIFATGVWAWVLPCLRHRLVAGSLLCLICGLVSPGPFMPYWPWGASVLVLLLNVVQGWSQQLPRPFLI